jgi:hypothetical protein
MNIVSEYRPRRVNFVMLPEFIPICPAHRVDMIAYKSKRLLTYFRCPQDGCECRDKAARKLFSAQRRDTSDGTSSAP